MRLRAITNPRGARATSVKKPFIPLEKIVRIRDCLRKSDLLFRMDGDEFMVVMPEIAAPENAAHVAQRIIAAVSAPATIYEHELTVGATAGIAVFPEDGETPDALVKNADAAMYSAKQAGRGTHAFYRAAMNERAVARLGLEEALLRWKSPSRGLVAPGDVHRRARGDGLDADRRRVGAAQRLRAATPLG